MAEIRWTEPALDDLRAIVDFVFRDSPAYAARLAQRIIEYPRRLATLPRSGARVPEFDRDDLRELSVRPFRVIYTLRDEECQIVAVIHGSRDLSALIDPDELS